MENSIVHAIILGIVEGITEFLPISSTAHLLLTERILGITSSAFSTSFIIGIQLGAILSVIIFSFKKLGFYLRNWSIYFIALLPTALVGLLLYPIIKDVFLTTFIIIPIALFVGGVCILFIEKRNTKEIVPIEGISYKQAFLLGLFQSLAVIPGVSRSASVIMGGRLLSISRIAIVEFSFILAIPTMIASTGYDFYKNGFLYTNHEYVLLLIGAGTACITASIVIKVFLAYIRKADFSIFAWYRIILAIILFLFLII